MDRAWHTHGYYGSASHNIKAIYQRYLGWYDGNPAHLWQHPPEAAAARYVEMLGGVDATVARAKAYADEGDPRFAAELAGHAVFAAPAHGPARELLASVLERLGYGAENATWRNKAWNETLTIGWHLTRPQLVGLLAGAKTDGVAIDGDASVLTRLTGLLDEPDPTFAVVTP